MLGIVMDITERKDAEEATRLSAQTREAAVIAERNRLAREIHDTLAQGFTGVIVQLQAADDARKHGLTAEADAHLVRAADSARYGLQEARRSVRALRPQALDGTDLRSALAGLFETMTTGTGVRAELIVSGAAEHLPAAWEDNLLRVVQEALTNVLRHAQATSFEAHISFCKEGLDLQLNDNGCGFDTRTRNDGFGLLGMTERVEAMGGRLTLRSTVGQGTTLRIKLLPIGETDLPR
ncbi:signal transduction histidine kinase [Sphingomonas sp. UYP23]